MIRSLTIVVLLAGSISSCTSVAPSTPVSSQKEIERPYVAEFFVKEIYFDKDQSDINEGSSPFLNEIAIDLKQHPGVKVELAGTRSAEESMTSMGMERALAARDYLINLGVQRERLTVADLGVTANKPCKYQEDICDKGNRRVIFRAPRR